MLKLFTVLGILVVAAPTLAAADNQKNNSSSQNSNSSSQNLNGVAMTAMPTTITANNTSHSRHRAGSRPAGL